MDVNWSAIWFSSAADLLNTFEKGFFWGQNRVHPTDSTSLPPPRSGYFIAPTSSPAQIPAVLAAHALHKLASAGVGDLSSSEFERYAATVLTPLLMGPNCAELCQLGFRTSGDQHSASTSTCAAAIEPSLYALLTIHCDDATFVGMHNFEQFCIKSLETLASLGATTGSSTIVCKALSSFMAQLFDTPEDGYATACFLHRAAVLGKHSAAIPPALLMAICESLAEKEADMASHLLQTVVEAVPAGFLGMENLHAGVAGLWWLVKADHVTLHRSFSAPIEVDQILQLLVQQFGTVIRLSSSDGYSAPWLGRVMAEVIEAVVVKLGVAYGASVLTDSPQHICDFLLSTITVCAELIVSSASTGVSTNTKRRLAGPASSVLNSVLRVLTDDNGQSALLDLGLVLPFSMFVSPLLKSMHGQVQQEEFAGGAVEMLGFIVQHDPTVSASCCTLLADLLLTKPGSMTMVRRARSLVLAFAYCSGDASRQDCIEALTTVLENGRHGSNKTTLYPSGLLFNLRRLFHQMDRCGSAVASRALHLFLDPKLRLLDCLLADISAAEDTPVDADIQEDETSILDVIHALMGTNVEVVSSALLIQSHAIDTIVELMVRVCHRANAQVREGESVAREPRRRTSMRVLLELLHQLATTQNGLDALESNHEALARLVESLGEIVVWPMYTSGRYSQSPWLAATLIARVAPLPCVTQQVKTRPWLLRQARAVIVANAQPTVVDVARRSNMHEPPETALCWQLERLLWLGCLKQNDPASASFFSILPIILIRRILCHLCPISRLLAPLYTVAGASISETIQRHEHARTGHKHSVEWTGTVDRYAQRLEMDAPALSLERCVPRLMRCDAGPWALRTGIVCQGSLSTFDPVSRRGTIQLLPGNALFHQFRMKSLK
eukprot:COSAG02_NODE_498_length_21087_cov_33.272394_12_plen_895_part_00